MTHEELVKAVLGECERLGLLAHYCTDGRACRGTKGFPDLVIAGRNGIIFAEIKSDGDTTTADQDLWATHLIRSSGHKTYTNLWTPSELKDGYIDYCLDLIK